MAGTVIQIRTPHTILALESERERRGYGSLARTAEQLVLERLAQLELKEGDGKGEQPDIRLVK